MDVDSRKLRKYIISTRIGVYACASYVSMGCTSSVITCGGRVARALRLLLLLVIALAAVEYLFGFFLDTSSFRIYPFTPLYNATQPTLRNAERLAATWPTFIAATDPINYPENNTQVKNLTVSVTTRSIVNPSAPIAINMTFSKHDTAGSNVTVQNVSTPTSLLVTKINDSIKNFVTTEVVVKKSDSSPVTLPLCDLEPPDLGPIEANKTNLELAFVEKRYPEIQWGGRYTPPNCTARHKVAIIVPYRDRQQHLAVFLNHMHPFLMKQQIDYGIFIVEQAGNKDFNRAKLMNVGFLESQRLEPDGWQCFIFHDIDLLPLDTRNLYSCPRQPRHMSASIDKHNFKLPYEDIFGGVSALTLEQFTNVNGFSNRYWGWGGEDDDMCNRLKKINYHIGRYKMSIARYAMLDHKKSKPNPKRYEFLAKTGRIFHKDGLSTIQYELIQVVQYHLYTNLLANIN